MFLLPRNNQLSSIVIHIYPNVGKYITVLYGNLFVYHTRTVYIYLSQSFLLFVQQRHTINTSTYQIGYLPKQQIAQSNSNVRFGLNPWNLLQSTLIRSRGKFCVGLDSRNSSSYNLNNLRNNQLETMPEY